MGGVTVIIDAEIFFTEIFKDLDQYQLENIKFEIYDANNKSDCIKETLLYDSEPASFQNKQSGNFTLHEKKVLDLNGRSWIILFYGTAYTNFNGLGVYLSVIFLIISILASLAISGVYLSLRLSKVRATHLAADITKELSDREKKYKKWLTDSPNPLIIISRDGTIEAVNEAVEKLFGFTTKEVIGKNFAQIGVFTPESLIRAAREFKKHLAGGEAVSYEVEFVKKNKTHFFGEINSKLIKEEGSIMGVFVDLHDITKEKITEDETSRKMSRLEKERKVMIGREKKIIELKKEIDQLRKKNK